MTKMTLDNTTCLFVRMLHDTGHTKAQIKYTTGLDDGEITHALQQTQEAEHGEVVRELKNYGN